MEIRRISGQQNRTLLEFYNSKEWPKHWGEMPKMMCDLIRFLDTISYKPVWAFTSHAELLLTDKDDYKQWQVLVKVIDVDGKQLYKINVAQKHPWHHLTGFADKANKAAELIIKGLSIAESEMDRNIFLDSN